MHDPKAPMTLLDLTDPHQQDILVDLLHSRLPDYIHLGMPCGTASRAREKPVSAHQRSLGAPNPNPLRSAEYPLGLPHINPETTAGIRLAKANILYRFAVLLTYLFRLCFNQCNASLHFGSSKHSCCKKTAALRVQHGFCVSFWAFFFLADFSCVCM